MVKVKMIEIIINAMFTGIGTATGLTIFEFFVRPRMKNLHKKVNKHKNVFMKMLKQKRG